jgi:hypothetical protein
MTTTKVFLAYTGSSVGKSFCVSADVAEGFHRTDCGRLRFFKSFEDLKNYWDGLYCSTSFQEMSYTANLV